MKEIKTKEITESNFNFSKTIEKIKTNLLATVYGTDRIITKRKHVPITFVCEKKEDFTQFPDESYIYIENYTLTLKIQAQTGHMELSNSAITEIKRKRAVTALMMYLYEGLFSDLRTLQHLVVDSEYNESSRNEALNLLKKLEDDIISI